MPVDEAEDYDADGGDGGDGSMDTGNMIHAALLLFLLLWIGRPQCREMCVEFWTAHPFADSLQACTYTKCAYSERNR